MQALYFETQGCMSLLCGQHAVNNLLGAPIYNESDLNSICYSFSDEWINPHKYIFGGDFSMDVLIRALQMKGHAVQWHDKRKEFNYDLKQHKSELVGFLLNTALNRSIFDKVLRTSARHWVCIKKVNNRFMFMDSKAGQPEYIGEKQQLNQFIQDHLRKQTHVSYVYK